MTDEKLRLGGMALRNGLLVHGPTHWAAAVRDRDGEIRVASGRKPTSACARPTRVPGLRGVTRLAEAMAVIPLVKRALPAGAAADQDRARRRDGRRRRGRPALRSRRRARGGPRGGRRAVSLAPALLALRGGDTRRLPRRRAQGDRRLRAGRGRRRRRGQGARPLRLQPRGADARRQRRRATSLLRKVVERPGPLAERCRGLGIAWRSRSRCSPGPSATPTRALATAAAAPGLRDPAPLGTREPDARAARGRPRRARRDPARRGRPA